ncbi:MAG: glycosyltransferase, partial [Candidatus Marinimicrobia bacterium]|nr:glycosyltransferase [Candidatus Neomarinimicrobiota bacterium]
MRIMQVIWGLDRGGAERVVVDLSLGLRDLGHDASVCCFVGGGPLQAELEALGVPVFVLPKRGRFGLTIIYRLARL